MVLSESKPPFWTRDLNSVLVRIPDSRHRANSVRNQLCSFPSISSRYSSCLASTAWAVSWSTWRERAQKASPSATLKVLSGR